MTPALRRRVLGGTLLALAVGAIVPLVAQDSWRTGSLGAFTRTGEFVASRLAEASGAAPSAANPGLFWTSGDSGNPPELLAIDTSGALRARVVLDGISNTDWEAVSVGRCGDATCIYVGDFGDNFERRREVAIHRIVEPKVTGVDPVVIHEIETLRFRYPTQSHDVEAMGVYPDGTLLLVTKGRSAGVLAYQIPPTAWDRQETVVATRVDSLPIVPSTGSGRLVTDLAIDSDGRRVVVRTYRDLYLFERRQDGTLQPVVACDILGREPQGEGIAWLPDGRLLLTSEKGLFARGTVHITTCR